MLLIAVGCDNRNYIRVTITVTSVERKTFDKSIWDASKPDCFQINTAEEIRLPDGRVCQSFVVMDETRGTSETDVFKKLYKPNGRQYWNKFKADVVLSIDPLIILYYDNMPVLVRVCKFIEPTPPE